MKDAILGRSPKVIVNAGSISERLKIIAQEINNDYQGLELDLVCLANSALLFTADLIRLITIPVRLHLMTFNSFSLDSKNGEVAITLDINESIEGRHILILEGLVVSGRTPSYVINFLRLRQPASIGLCIIGYKPKELLVELPIKYHMFKFDKEWVEGYGIGAVAFKGSSNLLDVSHLD